MFRGCSSMSSRGFLSNRWILAVCRWQIEYCQIDDQPDLRVEILLLLSKLESHNFDKELLHLAPSPCFSNFDSYDFKDLTMSPWCQWLTPRFPASLTVQYQEEWAWKNLLMFHVKICHHLVFDTLKLEVWMNLQIPTHSKSVSFLFHLYY